MKTETYGRMAIIFAAPKLWLEIPEEIKKSMSFSIFMKKIKTYLLEKVYLIE